MFLPTSIKLDSDLRMFSRTSGKTEVVELIQSINQSLRLILSSSSRELYGDPSFGCDLYAMIFDQEDDTLNRQLSEEIAGRINAQESRVVVNASSINFVKGLGTTLEIKVPYTISQTNYEEEFVYTVDVVTEE